jgi:hypothetical protein
VVISSYITPKARKGGAPTCRGTIGGRDWQRADLQRKYGSYFSAYLLARLARAQTAG